MDYQELLRAVSAVEMSNRDLRTLNDRLLARIETLEETLAELLTMLDDR